MMLRGTVVLAALLAPLACGPNKAPTSGTKVIGPDARPAKAGEWENTVAIMYDGALWCTGTLVAPKLVITAGHCVKGYEGNKDRFSIYRGLGEADQRFDGQYKVTKLAAHPAYNHDLSGWSDSAYMVLDKEVADIPLVPVATDLEELRILLQPGMKSTLVGFGVHDNGTHASGEKYIGTANVKYDHASEVFIGDSQGDGCNGDSGGPAFGQLPNGEWRVYGITSRGPSPCGADRWPGVWSLMHNHVCWIEQDSGVKIPGNTIDCNATPATLDDSQLAALNFLALCQDPALSGGQKRTIEALKVVFAAQRGGRSRDVTCEDLTNYLGKTTSLDLSKTMVNDLSPLAPFTQLESLAVEDAQVKDLRPLAHMSHLRVLHAGWNDVADFTPLAGLEARGLKIKGKAMQRPSWDFTKSDFLKMCNAAKGDDVSIRATVPDDHERDSISPANLQSVRAIKKMLCYAQTWCDCNDANQQLFQTRYLDLSNLPELTSLEPLKGVSSLQYLKIGKTGVTDFATLSTLENLRTLDVTGLSMSDHSAVADLERENGLRMTGP